MKKLAISLVTLFVFCMATAFAQSQDNSQGTTGSSPAASAPATPQGSSTMQNNDQTGGSAAQSGSTTGSGSSMSGQSGSSTGSGSSMSGQSDSSMSGDKMSGDKMHKDKGMMKGEKTMKGCIQSQNGQYMLEEKGGKMMNLTSSQDLSAHVGHMVKVHGSMAGATSGSDTKTFTVSSVDMVSDTCSMGGKMDKKDKMGNPGNTTQPQ